MQTPLYGRLLILTAIQMSVAKEYVKIKSDVDFQESVLSLDRNNHQGSLDFCLICSKE